MDVFLLEEAETVNLCPMKLLTNKNFKLFAGNFLPSKAEDT